MRRSKKWINDKTRQDRSWNYHPHLFHCLIDLGIFSRAARSANAAHRAHRVAVANSLSAVDPIYFITHMRFNRPALVIATLAVLVLCGCVLFYFLSSQSLSMSAPPPAEEPGNVQATAPVEGDEPGAVEATALPTSELLTSIVPEVTAQPALPERRRLTLEFPPQIRAGDTDVVRLTLEVDDLGNVTPTAEIGGNVVTGKVVEIPNLYESHHVIAEARFDIAGMEVRPSELISEPLSQGSSATFYWSIRPEAVGSYRGTIWLYLRFVDKQTGEESRKTISAQIVEMEAVNFLGFSGALARTTGVVGSVVGTIIGFPFFEDILKSLIKRRNKPK
jgi:hypothetical protein